MKERLLALLLALVMAFSMLPASAMAEETPADNAATEQSGAQDPLLSPESDETVQEPKEPSETLLQPAEVPAETAPDLQPTASPEAAEPASTEPQPAVAPRSVDTTNRQEEPIIEEEKEDIPYLTDISVCQFKTGKDSKEISVEGDAGEITYTPSKSTMFLKAALSAETADYQVKVKHPNLTGGEMTLDPAVYKQLSGMTAKNLPTYNGQPFDLVFEVCGKDGSPVQTYTLTVKPEPILPSTVTFKANNISIKKSKEDDTYHVPVGTKQIAVTIRNSYGTTMTLNGQPAADGENEVALYFEDGCALLTLTAAYDGSEAVSTTYTFLDESMAPLELLLSGNIPTEVRLGDDLDLSGVTFLIKYLDGSTKPVEAKDILVSGYDNTTPGTQTVSLSYRSLTAIITVKVKGAAENVITLIEALPSADILTLDDAEAVSAAQSAFDNLSDSEKAEVPQEMQEKLAAAATRIAELRRESIAELEEKAFQNTSGYLSGAADEYGIQVGSTGGEWIAIGLARAELMTGAQKEAYYQVVETYINENILAGEKLHRNKSTENSRVILALTAAGYDPTDVAGHNLLAGLTDMSYLKRQGINGPIWALIAFDSHGYDIPAADAGGVQVTREGLIDYILDARTSDGGWSLAGFKADPDMTGMALQALAPYYDSNPEVRSAVDGALDTLSALQSDNGDFHSWGSDNSESCVQTIVALTALGLDPATDSRFIKNGHSVLEALLNYSVEGGGFRHTADGALDGMATEQGYYALVAYRRFLSGAKSLYDMTDVSFDADGENEPDGEEDDKPGKEEGNKPGSEEDDNPDKGEGSKPDDKEDNKPDSGEDSRPNSEAGSQPNDKQPSSGSPSPIGNRPSGGRTLSLKKTNTEATSAPEAPETEGWAFTGGRYTPQEIIRDESVPLGAAPDSTGTMENGASGSGTNAGYPLLWIPTAVVCCGAAAAMAILVRKKKKQADM